MNVRYYSCKWENYRLIGGFGLLNGGFRSQIKGGWNFCFEVALGLRRLLEYAIYYLVPIAANVTKLIICTIETEYNCVILSFAGQGDKLMLAVVLLDLIYGLYVRAVVT